MLWIHIHLFTHLMWLWYVGMFTHSWTYVSNCFLHWTCEWNRNVFESFNQRIATSSTCRKDTILPAQVQVFSSIRAALDLEERISRQTWYRAFLLLFNRSRRLMTNWRRLKSRFKIHYFVYFLVFRYQRRY